MEETIIKVVAIVNNKLKINEDVTPFNPSSGTDRNLAIIRFLTEMKNKRNIIKFLCSEYIIFLKATFGSSINWNKVFHKSIFTTRSLKYDLQFSQVFLCGGFM
ncbi:MAG: hypothetical protein IPH97_03410 [Ignavibacteriales bacterium]|nr:hypothetical protein [Ignavibacteriales bacterium]